MTDRLVSDPRSTLHGLMSHPETRDAAPKLKDYLLCLNYFYYPLLDNVFPGRDEHRPKRALQGVIGSH